MVFALVAGKFGVPVVQSSITPQTTTKLSSYLSDLKNRSDTSSAPSVKRLKVTLYTVKFQQTTMIQII